MHDAIAMLVLLELLVLVVTVLVPPSRADALCTTAPHYLTRDSASMHLAAASVTGLATGTEPALLLSIAHHESRYAYRVVAAEPGRKISCGVMTPEPTHDVAACRDTTISIAAGYLAGARHLRHWFDACHGNRRCALLGYAGGYALIAACARGEQLRGCFAPDVFTGRAALIDHRLGSS